MYNSVARALGRFASSSVNSISANSGAISANSGSIAIRAGACAAGLLAAELVQGNLSCFEAI